MNKLLIAIIIIILLIPVGVIFSIPYSDPNISSPFISHGVLVLTIDQGILFVIAGILTYLSMFRSKQLGGVVGIGLRIFSIGLIGLGIGFIQFPIMLFLNAWHSFYFTSGLYYIAYAVGGIGMITGLIVTAINYKANAVRSFLAILAIAIVFRIIGFLYPGWLGTQGQSASQLQLFQTINAILLAIGSTLLVFSSLLWKTFGKSVIGDIFRNIFIGFLFLLIAVLFTLHENLTGENHWYYTSGIYFLIIFCSSVAFAVFGFRLKKLTLSK